MRVNEVLKYLGGGWIIYAAMASCSGKGGSSSAATTGNPDAGGGMMGMGNDASPVPDANAQTAGANGDSCGTCSVPSPLPIVSPENDPTRWEIGEVPVSPIGQTLIELSGTLVAKGPLVVMTLVNGALTDA